MQAAYDPKIGYLADAFTVASFGDPPIYKGVWSMRTCCHAGHPTPKEAANHAAVINRDRAVYAWLREEANVS